MLPNVGFDLTNHHIHLAEDGGTAAVRIDDAFWAGAASRKELREGRLMGALQMAPGVSHWEMHPAGDEVLVLLSGAVDVLLEEPGGQRTIALRGTGACIVPRGTWHAQVVHCASDLVFVTPGRDTRHRSTG